MRADNVRGIRFSARSPLCHPEQSECTRSEAFAEGSRVCAPTTCEESAFLPAPHSVILSEVNASRSEAFAESKDPYLLLRSRDASGCSPRTFGRTERASYRTKSTRVPIHVALFATLGWGFCQSLPKRPHGMINATLAELALNGAVATYVALIVCLPAVSVLVLYVATPLEFNIAVSSSVAPL